MTNEEAAAAAADETARISFRLDQKMGNFKMATKSRKMQCFFDSTSALHFNLLSHEGKTWQITQAPSPLSADNKMSGPQKTRAAAATCTQQWTPPSADDSSCDEGQQT